MASSSAGRRAIANQRQVRADFMPTVGQPVTAGALALVHLVAAGSVAGQLQGGLIPGQHFRPGAIGTAKDRFGPRLDLGIGMRQQRRCESRVPLVRARRVPSRRPPADPGPRPVARPAWPRFHPSLSAWRLCQTAIMRSATSAARCRDRAAMAANCSGFGFLGIEQGLRARRPLARRRNTPAAARSRCAGRRAAAESCAARAASSIDRVTRAAPDPASRLAASRAIGRSAAGRRPGPSKTRAARRAPAALRRPATSAISASCSASPDDRGQLLQPGAPRPAPPRTMAARATLRPADRPELAHSRARRSASRSHPASRVAIAASAAYGSWVAGFAQREGDLHPHARLRVVGQFDNFIEQLRRRRQPRFGQPHRMLAHARRKDRPVRAAARLPASAPSPSSAHSMCIRPTSEVDSASRRRSSADGGRILPLEYQPRGRVAPPAAGMFQCCDELGRRGLAQLWLRRRLEARRRQAIDASLVAAAR